MRKLNRVVCSVVLLVTLTDCSAILGVATKLYSSKKGSVAVNLRNGDNQLGNKQQVRNVKGSLVGGNATTLNQPGNVTYNGLSWWVLVFIGLGWPLLILDHLFRFHRHLRRRRKK